jgi:hypothetical protein
MPSASAPSEGWLSACALVGKDAVAVDEPLYCSPRGRMVFRLVLHELESRPELGVELARRVAAHRQAAALRGAIGAEWPR